MPSAPGAERLVLLKATFLKAPCSGNLVRTTQAGVWIDSLELASAIQRVLAGVTHEAVPSDEQFLRNRKVLFIPFAQIEWILSERAQD
jgi:hypothetical protein